MDKVNHPEHYTGSCSMECIDVMEMIFGAKNLAVFSVINAFKYVWRWQNKNGKEDLEKATWYLNKFESLHVQDCSSQAMRLRIMIKKFMEEEND